MANITANKSPGLSNGQVIGQAAVDAVDLTRTSLHDKLVSDVANPVLNSQGNDAWIANKIEAPDAVVSLVEAVMPSVDGTVKASKTTTSSYRSSAQNAVIEGGRAEQYALSQGATPEEAQKAKDHAATYVTASGREETARRLEREALQQEMIAEALDEADARSEENGAANGIAEDEVLAEGIADADKDARGETIIEAEALAEGIDVSDELTQENALAEGIAEGDVLADADINALAAPSAEADQDAAMIGAEISVGVEEARSTASDVSNEVEIAQDFENGLDEANSAALGAANDLPEAIPFERALQLEEQRAAYLADRRAERAEPASPHAALQAEFGADESDALTFVDAA